MLPVTFQNLLKGSLILLQRDEFNMSLYMAHHTHEGSGATVDYAYQILHRALPDSDTRLYSFILLRGIHKLRNLNKAGSREGLHGVFKPTKGSLSL